MAAVRRNWLPVAAAVASGALLTAGCGTHETVRAGRSLNVALTEYRIDPGSASVASGIVRLVVSNDGRLTHNLVVAQDGHQQAATSAIPPGTDATLLMFLSPGHYTMSSTILQDADLGARAELTVR